MNLILNQEPLSEGQSMSPFLSQPMKSCCINWSTGGGHSSSTSELITQADSFWGRRHKFEDLTEAPAVFCWTPREFYKPLFFQGLKSCTGSCMPILYWWMQILFPDKGDRSSRGVCCSILILIDVEVKILSLLDSSPWLLWDLSDHTCTGYVQLCNNTNCFSLCWDLDLLFYHLTWWLCYLWNILV